MPKKGDKVKVEYEGKLEDGTFFDSSEKHGQPIEFEVGSGQIIPGFENAIMEMNKEDEREIKIKADEAYGQPNPELVKKIPKLQLPQDQEIKEGMMLAMGLPNGQQVPGKVTKIAEETITIDFNHPLAGKDLTFKLKLIDITPATA